MKNKTEKQVRGQIGEQLATVYLHNNLDWRIIERNWRCRRGEIDIIAEDHGTLVFVEVKTRNAHTEVDPGEAVDLEKRRRLRAAVQDYLNMWDEPLPYRYDIIAVWLDANNRLERLELRGNAFEDEHAQDITDEDD